MGSRRPPRPKMHEHMPILAVLLLFTIHLFGIAFFNLYELWPDFDIVTHFIGGFAIGILGIHILDRIGEHHDVRQWVWWHELLFVIGFVTIVAVLWEFHEYFLDVVVGKWLAMTRSQLSLTDTMGDLFMGWLGGFTAHLFRRPLSFFGLRFGKK